MKIYTVELTVEELNSFFVQPTIDPIDPEGHTQAYDAALAKLQAAQDAARADRARAGAE